MPRLSPGRALNATAVHPEMRSSCGVETKRRLQIRRSAYPPAEECRQVVDAFLTYKERGQRHLNQRPMIEKSRMTSANDYSLASHSKEN
jgi:hypothetical protein